MVNRTLTQFYCYGMGHKKVPVSCLVKSHFLAVQRKNGTFGTRHGAFHGKLNGPFNGKLNGPFNGKLNGPFNGKLNGPFNGN